MKRTWVMALIVGASLSAHAPLPTAPEARPTGKVGELERLGEGGQDLMILGVEAPGFDKLRPSQRKLAYFLSRAAIAGNEITYFQNHRTAHEIKELLEEIYTRREGLADAKGVDPKAMEGLEEYLKLVWAHHGQYNHTHHTKFVPRLLTFEQLKALAHAAQKKGAKFELAKGETLDKKLARLKPHIFDPKVEPIQVNQVQGQDPVATSSNGLYDPGLAAKDIEALPEELQHKLNVRFGRVKTKKGMRAEAQEFKVGGVYGEQLANVVYWLKKAQPWLETVRADVEKEGGAKASRLVPNPNQKKAIDDLIAYFESGDEAKFRDYSVAWLKTRSVIDYLNGFYEVYKDPRSVVGSYEANVSFRADSDKVEKLSQSALYFEGKMPWDAKWQRQQIEPPVASVVNVLIETGDSGPMSPAAYNLPNYNDIRKQVGSKNVILLNIEGAQSQQIKQQTLKEFYLPEDQETVARFGDLGRQWLVYMHEVIGHGSGQVESGLAADPAKLIGGTYSALEECRADCVALYQFLDPKVVEIGAVAAPDQEAAARAMYLKYLVGQLMANGLVEGDTVREAHFRGRQLVLNFLTQEGKDYGVAVVQKDGKNFVQLLDVQKARTGVAEILKRLQAFKSTGDKAGADQFFADFGTKVNKAWQADAKARMAELHIPRDRAYVFPHLVPLMGEAKAVHGAAPKPAPAAPAAHEGDGAPAETPAARQSLQDVKLANDETFAEQMLRFKRLSKSREIGE